MRGGNNIKSTSEKQLAGTSRKDRDDKRLENSTPVLTVVPPPPKYFGKEHRKKWQELAVKLISMGVLAEADLDALTMLVQTWILRDEAWQDIEDSGSVIIVDTKQGKKPIKNPSYAIYIECEKVLKPLLEQFGMTPKARQGIKVETKSETDPLAELLKRNAN